MIYSAKSSFCSIIVRNFALNNLQTNSICNQVSNIIPIYDAKLVSLFEKNK